MFTQAYAHTPESPEVRSFAALRAFPPSFGMTWHGTRREALQLRRAIHQQVCDATSESGPMHPVCRPTQTPVFTQQELDHLVFIKRTAARYTTAEFQA
jgi:hypothetical protein